MQLRPMPGEIQALLEAAPDYQPVDRGKGRGWIQIANDNDVAELVVYRASANRGALEACRERANRAHEAVRCTVNVEADKGTR